MPSERPTYHPAPPALLHASFSMGETTTCHPMSISSCSRPAASPFHCLSCVSSLQGGDTRCIASCQSWLQAPLFPRPVASWEDWSKGMSRAPQSIASCLAQQHTNPTNNDGSGKGPAPTSRWFRERRQHQQGPACFVLSKQTHSKTLSILCTARLLVLAQSTRPTKQPGFQHTSISTAAYCRICRAANNSSTVQPRCLP